MALFKKKKTSKQKKPQTPQMVSFGSRSVLEVNHRMAGVGRGSVQSSLGLLAVL